MRKLTLLLLVSVILGAFLTVEAIAQRSRVSAKQGGGSIVIGKTVQNPQGVVSAKWKTSSSASRVARNTSSCPGSFQGRGGDTIQCPGLWFR